MVVVGWPGEEFNVELVGKLTVALSAGDVGK